MTTTMLDLLGQAAEPAMEAGALVGAGVDHDRTVARLVDLFELGPLIDAAKLGAEILADVDRLRLVVVALVDAADARLDLDFAAELALLEADTGGGVELDPGQAAALDAHREGMAALRRWARG